MIHKRSTALEWSVKKNTGGLNRFHGAPTSPLAPMRIKKVVDSVKLPRICAALIVETKPCIQPNKIIYVQRNQEIDTGAPH